MNTHHTLRRTRAVGLALALAGGVALSGGALGDLPAAEAATTKHCTVTPSMPKKIVLDTQSVDVPVWISKPSCKFYASYDLVLERKYEMMGVGFDDQDLTERPWINTYEETYPKVTGKWRLEPDYVEPEDGYSVTLKPSNWSVAKYKSRTSFKVKRKGKKLTFTVTARRYDGLQDRYVTNSGAKVKIQKLVGSKWKTKKTVKLAVLPTATVNITDKKSGYWRVVSGETRVSWGSAAQYKKVKKS